MTELLFLLTFTTVSYGINNDTTMKKIDPDTVPRSVIKGSGVIMGDLSHPQGTLNILYLTPKIVVAGINDSAIPFALNITPDFNWDSLPPYIFKNLGKIKQLYLKPSFSVDREKDLTYCAIPDWIADYKEVEVLKLEFVDLDGFSKLSHLPLKQITFVNVRYGNVEELVKTLNSIKGLQEVLFDQSMKEILEHIAGETSIKFVPL